MCRCPTRCRRSRQRQRQSTIDTRSDGSGDLAVSPQACPNAEGCEVLAPASLVCRRAPRYFQPETCFRPVFPMDALFQGCKGHCTFADEVVVGADRAKARSCLPAFFSEFPMWMVQMLRFASSAISNHRPSMMRGTIEVGGKTHRSRLSRSGRPRTRRSRP